MVSNSTWLGCQNNLYWEFVPQRHYLSPWCLLLCWSRMDRKVWSAFAHCLRVASYIPVHVLQPVGIYQKWALSSPLIARNLCLRHLSWSVPLGLLLDEGLSWCPSGAQGLFYRGNIVFLCQAAAFLWFASPSPLKTLSCYRETSS